MSQRYGLCVSARTSPRPTFEPVEPPRNAPNLIEQRTSWRPWAVWSGQAARTELRETEFRIKPREAGNYEQCNKRQGQGRP